MLDVCDDIVLDTGRSGRRVLVSTPTRSRYLGDVRRAIRAAVGRLGASATFVADVILVVDELCSNAVEHGDAGRVRVLVDASPSGAVTVHIASPGSLGELPPIGDWTMPGPAARSGRGLSIVRRLADEVTVGEHDGYVVIRTRLRPADV